MGPASGLPMPNGHPTPMAPVPASKPPVVPPTKTVQEFENTWVKLGTVAEVLGESERAVKAYQTALQHNPYSVPALSLIAAVHRSREEYRPAAEYFQRVLNIDGNNGEVWGTLGHCYLMLDDLAQAFAAYQKALQYLSNPKEPKLWYGIGILYDRYENYEYAEEAFSAVLNMDPKFEKANEIQFRLGMICKSLQKYSVALQQFQRALDNPPKPLVKADILFQLAHVHDLNKAYAAAREYYEKVLAENPAHPKALFQLGWLYDIPKTGFTRPDYAETFLTRAVELEPKDSQAWYLLGRYYINHSQHTQAYEAYQQAVRLNEKNALYWCSIGVLYFQTQQFRDALDAYSRALGCNTTLSEVWYNLGILYETCNNQMNDAFHAYSRVLEYEPGNPIVQHRVQAIQQALATGNNVALSNIPQPREPVVEHHQSVSPSGITTGSSKSLLAGSSGANGTLPAPRRVNEKPAPVNPSQPLGPYGADAVRSVGDQAPLRTNAVPTSPYTQRPPAGPVQGRGDLGRPPAPMPSHGGPPLAPPPAPGYGPSHHSGSGYPIPPHQLAVGGNRGVQSPTKDQFSPRIAERRGHVPPPGAPHRGALVNSPHAAARGPPSHTSSPYTTDRRVPLGYRGDPPPQHPPSSMSHYPPSSGHPPPPPHHYPHENPEMAHRMGMRHPAEGQPRRRSDIMEGGPPNGGYYRPEDAQRPPYYGNPPGGPLGYPPQRPPSGGRLRDDDYKGVAESLISMGDAQRLGNHPSSMSNGMKRPPMDDPRQYHDYGHDNKRMGYPPGPA
ncbi:glucose repression mediator protein [Dispira parvispora]|uniref:Glucose repression mediator protein n=1 Tax=Dispira parvispora TaxID=1520584 RepID=A0A9W8AR46_9FUNG|nr:glucose repression mediator protein [Dispira parvispora]